MRFAAADSLERYVSGSALHCTAVSRAAALEENFFLGLRLKRGVDLRELPRNSARKAVESAPAGDSEFVEAGLMQLSGDVMIFLTSRGSLLSNEVFESFIGRADRCLLKPVHPW